MQISLLLLICVVKANQYRWNLSQKKFSLFQFARFWRRKIAVWRATDKYIVVIDLDTMKEFIFNSQENQCTIL